MKRISKDELFYLIDSYIFNQRNREVMKRRLYDGITYEKLAEEFDLSVNQIKSIVYKNQAIIFELLGDQDENI